VFFLIGGGKAEPRIREAADKMNLRSRLTFVDRQVASQLQGILKSADIYISPRNTPHVDLTSLLAMAAGDPVLAARSQADDFFIDGRTALTFNAGNAAELTVKLASILEDRQAGAALADSALEYLREHHSAAQMVSAVAGIYRRAVEAPRAVMSQ
jgi:glycosyltransferase involved in cell wall biosynthesis